MRTFAITGVAGFVAPRHLDAIAHNGGRIVAGLDPSDSVGVLDRYDLDAEFFVDEALFTRYLSESPRRLDYLTICTPNHVHEAQCRLGLRAGADVICEKPVVIEPNQLDGLARIEEETGHRIWTVLQLRSMEKLRHLRTQLSITGPHDVLLTYVTARGRWYDASWKANVDCSGGIATNIGIHTFDLLTWLFGPVHRCELHLRHRRKMAGFFEHDRARVRWFLSVDASDLPSGVRMHRVLHIDGQPLDFADGFGALHRDVYADILAGRGLGLQDARPSIELAARVRRMETVMTREATHPHLRA